MPNFDLNRLKRELGQISQKVESDKDKFSEKVLEFCDKFLSHSDIMIVAKHDSNDTRYQKINEVCQRYIEENLSEAEVKSLLSGTEIEPTEHSQINKIFRAWVKYHLVTDKALQTSHRFFSQIKFSEDDLALLSEFPDNAGNGRIQELLIVFGEFYDGVVDIPQAELNLYPDRFREVEKTVHYRNDVANFLDKPQVETVTEIQEVEPEPAPQPENSKFENSVKVQWTGKGANGSFSIPTTEGRQTVYREKVYIVSEQTYKNLTNHRPGVKIDWQRV